MQIISVTIAIKLTHNTKLNKSIKTGYRVQVGSAVNVVFEDCFICYAHSQYKSIWVLHNYIPDWVMWFHEIKWYMCCRH